MIKQAFFKEHNAPSQAVHCIKPEPSWPHAGPGKGTRKLKTVGTTGRSGHDHDDPSHHPSQ
eukprot:2986666-Rhodomonas_salina.1